MDTRASASFPRAPLALAAAIVLVFVAAVSLITGWFAPTLEQYRHASAAGAHDACGVCGVVEFVRELEPGPAAAGVVPLGGAAPGFHLSGGRGEGAAILLTAFGTALAERPAGARRGKAYEVAVRMEDGSVRVLREGSAPGWKPGDRVRVTRGRVVPPG